MFMWLTSIINKTKHKHLHIERKDERKKEKKLCVEQSREKKKENAQE